MKYVYSTGTTNVEYNAFTVPPKGNIPQRIRRVVVRGGANVANKNFITPKGVVTKISDEDADFLLQNDSFKRHVKAGFVVMSNYLVDADGVAVNDLEPKDRSAPKTPGDFVKVPKVGKDLPVAV